MQSTNKYHDFEDASFLKDFLSNQYSMSLSSDPLGNQTLKHQNMVSFSSLIGPLVPCSEFEIQYSNFEISKFDAQVDQKNLTF